MTDLSVVIPASEARTNFYELLSEAESKFRQYTVTLRGKAKAVIMSAEEFASWQETLDIISDKKLVESIKRGLREEKTVSSKQADKQIGW